MSDLGEASFDVIVVGAGAAGIGVGVALKHAGIDDFLIIDRIGVGASFERWPAETRFITPSFPTNSIGMLDLNSIAIGVSPAYSLESEHPTGQQYAKHLQSVAGYFELPIVVGLEVNRVAKADDTFLVDTPKQTFRCKHLIWAAGEFQYPKVASFEGSDFCQHTATIDSYAELKGDNFLIIGGYESGVDAAYHLAKTGRHSRLIDSGCPWQQSDSDPSISLSTYSLERVRDDTFKSHVELIPDSLIDNADFRDDQYVITTVDGREYESLTPPLMANGFDGSVGRISDLFESREDGFPLLNESDESTISPGLFLCGPSVRHEGHVFCFIYKYRQRFAVVAKTIATRLGLPAEELEMYRMWGMYLDDLSCCGEECVC